MYSKPQLLSPLRLFQISILAKFLPARQKLSVLVCLNSRWKDLIFSNYAWKVFPEFHPYTLFADQIRFFNKFSSLNGVDIPVLDIALFNKSRLDFFLSASSLKFRGQWELHHTLLLQHNPSLQPLVRCIETKFRDSKDLQLLNLVPSIEELTADIECTLHPAMCKIFEQTTLKSLTLIISSEKAFITIKQAQLQLSALASLKILKLVVTSVYTADQSILLRLPSNLESLHLENIVDEDNLVTELFALSSLKCFTLLSNDSSHSLFQNEFPFALQKLTVSSFRDSMTLQQNSILSLQIRKQTSTLIIKSMPLLQSITINQAKAGIFIQDLPSLRQLTFQNFQAEFIKGLPESQKIEVSSLFQNSRVVYSHLGFYTCVQIESRRPRKKFQPLLQRQAIMHEISFIERMLKQHARIK